MTDHFFCKVIAIRFHWVLVKLFILMGIFCLYLMGLFIFWFHCDVDVLLFDCCEK